MRPPLTAEALAARVTALSGLPLQTPVAVAVSGGADSLALLRLANAAFPVVQLLTMDHGLRAESATEADMVVERARELGVPAAVLRPASPLPAGNLQHAARQARYQAMAGWCRNHRLPLLLTAHHADDQAETLLLRLARGSGLAGLTGIREARDLDGVQLLRPLLGWTRAELRATLADSGWTPVDDPSNRDPRFDRTRARQLLADTPWLDATQLAHSAACLADAEAALHWAATRAFDSRVIADGPALIADAEGLPAELRRRLLLQALAALGAQADGPTLQRLLHTLDSGRAATIAGVKATPLRCGQWRLAPAPPRAQKDRHD